jgi:diguanylate cyclase (GGDEF)-like protein/putative nucleotidyltransferase with HDIG domain
MTWKTLPPAVRLYVATVILVGAVPLFVAIMLDPPQLDAALAAVLLLAGAAASQKLVFVGRPGAGRSRSYQMSTVSLGFPVVLGGLLHFGVTDGVLVAIASALGASCYPRQAPFHRAAFTASNLGLAGLISGCAMRALSHGGGAAGAEGPLPLEAAPLPLLVGTLSYFLVNTVMVAVVVALSQRKAPLRVWRDDFLWTAPSYVAGGILVAVVFQLATRWGSAVAALSLLCLYLLYSSYNTYLQKVRQLEDNQQRLEQVYLATVESLAMVIDAKDSSTRGQIHRVQALAVALAERVAVSGDELTAIRVAALVHDIGKLAVPESILSKPGRLTEAEFERIKGHVAIGASILERVGFPWPVVPIVLAHHERWDGSGYPNGLRGEAIPIGARIIALVDVFDALIATRPYRPALGRAEALAVVQAGSGSQFEPRLVLAFLEMLPGIDELLELPAATDAAAVQSAAPADPLSRVLEEIRGASRELLQEWRESSALAVTDSLTGLPNLRYLMTLLDRELPVALRTGRPLALLLLDLDNFKTINDRCGHLKGDEVLQFVATRLRAVVREGSTVCRYAGDEFIIVLPETSREEAAIVAARLEGCLADWQTPEADVRIGLSVGLASFPEDGADIRSMLYAADQDMYQAKSRHKGRLAGSRDAEPSNVVAASQRDGGG